MPKQTLEKNIATEAFINKVHSKTKIGGATLPCRAKVRIPSFSPCKNQIKGELI